MVAERKTFRLWDAPQSLHVRVQQLGWRKDQHSPEPTLGHYREDAGGPTKVGPFGHAFETHAETKNTLNGYGMMIPPPTVN